MIKLKYLLLLTVVLNYCLPTQARGLNGGFSCAACTILFGMAEQLAEIHNGTIMEGSLWLCRVLPSPASTYCAVTIKKLEPLLIDPELYKFFTPDVFCYSIGSCYVEKTAGYCHLFPRPVSTFPKAVEQLRSLLAKHLDIDDQLKQSSFDFCSLPVVRRLCWLFEKTGNTMEPVVDLDGDLYSLLAPARGSNWRGRDCRDFDPTSHPGRSTPDLYADYNCNGIWGVNPDTRQSYETELCSASGDRGVVYMGDSVGAHFHFPEVWMNPSLLSFEVMHNYTEHLLDELDWPQLGFATGFTNTSEPLLIQGTTDSIYLRIRARNRCNHRDYQNLSRNGANSYDLIDFVKIMARGKSDKPVFVIYAVFGNDVCNRFRDTIANMTKPHKFRKNVMTVLKDLDSRLPNGSHVLLMGLVDGGRIYPAMADRFHPLGQLHQNIRYRDVYDWFSCMEIGPCVGWMNTNATLRKITTQRARKLNDVLYDISTRESFASFALSYLRNPLEEVWNEWTVEGKPVWRLMDPIDSLHPSQEAQPLIADMLWNDILKKLPEALGDVNPNNLKIETLFGDQGGH